MSTEEEDSGTWLKVERWPMSAERGYPRMDSLTTIGGVPSGFRIEAHDHGESLMFQGGEWEAEPVLRLLLDEFLIAGKPLVWVRDELSKKPPPGDQPLKGRVRPKP